MARRNSNDDIPQELVPIDSVAVRSGFPPETVWGKLREDEVLEAWDHTPCIRSSRATAILDELVAAREENNRWNRENIDAQIEREKEGRLAPYRAWQHAVASEKGKVPGGVAAFGPGDPTPGWAEEVDE